jgi:hypothetical protein
MKQGSLTEIVLGLWLVVSPFVIGRAGARPVVEDLIPGVFLCATSGWILWHRSALRVAWLQALCGLALVVGSFAFLFGGLPQAAVNNLVVGLLVLFAYFVSTRELVRELR